MPPTLADLLLRPDLFHAHPLLAEYQIRLRHSELWVCFNGPIEQVPFLAAHIRYRAPRIRVPEIPDHFRWRTLSEWYEEGKFWRPYAPDGRAIPGVAERRSSWVFDDYEDLTRYRDAAFNDRFSREAVRAIASDFEAAGELLDVFDGKYGLQRTFVSTAFNANSLYLSRTDSSLRYDLTVARVAMLDAIAAVSYIVHRLPHDERWEVLLETYGEELRDWAVLDAPKMGCLLDLNSTYHAPVPLLEWLKHGVPVYYPWDEEYRPSSSLLSRLHPEHSISEASFAADVDLVCGGSLVDLPPLPSTAANHAPSLSERLDAAPAVPLSATNDTVCRQLRGQAASVMQPLLFFNRAPVHPLVGQSWSLWILSHGVLRLPTITEAKLRTYALLNRTTDVDEILSVALERGMEIGILYTDDDLYDLQQSRPVPRPRYFQETTTSAILPYNEAGLDEAWDDYVIAARAVLSRPHAVAFILRGGILGRLAREFGPPSLVANALTSPSATLVHYTHGDASLPGYHEDSVSDAESYRLVGVVLASEEAAPTRRWWPTPADLVDNDFFVGEWTAAHEEWFCRRLQQIRRRTRFGRPLTDREWKKELGSRGIKLREDRDELPQQEDLDRLCAGLETSMGPWTYTPIRDIRLFDD